MPKIKQLTKAEKKCQKKQRAIDYYTKYALIFNIPRFLIRDETSKKREASAERNAEIEVTELAERKNSACFKSRALAQWPRKATPSKHDDEYSDSASSSGKPGDDDQGSKGSAANFTSDRTQGRPILLPYANAFRGSAAKFTSNRKQGRPISLPYANAFRIQCHATTTTRPFSSAENDVDSLPPSSAPSYSDEELYDSDNSIPIAPYD
ncbi:hypothetical protein AGABI2DRAFT_122516 [Agaricus bisporus var. bisporus H97]|uniref:hypothetical protein n=1 Tax=Agaricus bisporus var. bisporus (strain H97 / ATCC MYA-4626 / FGSC 10389) TaxID=936046 RepID=UPI00029F7824|nr:hypothetical protein AGABI2DRAFT_122516 [Agaricus bisporus var. bisporus H97]EKV42950.1 hypothetical protein AGABI2DRAFT_122516 [Agaricus bisporus var. bisporus H97]